MSLARSGAWLLLDNLSAAAIAFGFFVVSARMLPSEAFGVAIVAVSVSQMAQPLIESLFHDAVIQREDLRAEDIRTATTANIWWAVAVALALILAAPFVAAATRAPELARLLPWIAISVAASGVTAVPIALARRRMAFRALALRTVAARTISAVVGIVLLWRGFGAEAVVAQTVLAIMLSSAFVLLFVRPDMGWTLDRKRLAPLLRFAAPAMGTQVLLFAGSRMVTLVVSGMLGPAAAGLWGVALRFAEPVQTMAATTLGQFTLPLYARRQASVEDMRAMYLSASRHAGVVLVPLFVGLGACAPLIVELFVGARWLGAAPLMAIICLVLAVITGRQIVEIALTASGAPHLNLAVQSAAIVLALIGTVIGAHWGLLGATIGWALRVVPFVTLAAAFLRVRLGLGYRIQARDLAPVLLAAGVMTGAVTIVRHSLAPVAGLPVTLAASVLAGAIVYAAAIALLMPRTFADLRGALVGAIGRSRPATP